MWFWACVIVTADVGLWRHMVGQLAFNHVKATKAICIHTFNGTFSKVLIQDFVGIINKKEIQIIFVYVH